MSPFLQQILTLVISVLALGCSATIVILTFKRDNKSINTEDTTKEVRIAENFKEINVKLDLLSKQFDKLTLNSEESTRQFIDMNAKITKISEQILALFKYKDDHENRIRDLEEKTKK